MNEELICLLLGLFPGLLFSKLYLRHVPEVTSTLELKLISFHGILAVIYGTIFLIFCIFLSKIINLIFVIPSPIKPTSSSGILLPFLLLYLLSFIIAFKTGRALCKKKFLYSYFKEYGRWDRLFIREPQKNYFITTIVETGGQSWLYIGMLDNYVTKDGELELIHLKRPYRRQIGKENDKEQEKKSQNGSASNKAHFKDRYYRIDVDVLTIRYQDIRSLGVRGVFVE